MKHLFIGDVHGTTTWKKYIDLENYDHITFVGDYIDSFTITGNDLLNNLADLIDLKQKHFNQITLLAGNHDNSYIYYHTDLNDIVRCSGFRSSIAWRANDLYKRNLACFQAAEQIGKILVTHAGLTQSIFKEDIEPFWDKSISLADHLNIMWHNGYQDIFKVGYARGGDYPQGSIFWADKSELVDDPLVGYDQIVGHTPVEHIEHIICSPDINLTFIDCIEHGEPDVYKLVTEDIYE